MKKLLYIVAVFIIIGCKNDKKETKPESPVVVEEKVIGQIPISGIENWQLLGVSLTNTGETYQAQDIHKMAISDSNLNYSFAAINNVKLNYTGGRYKISIMVKSSKETDNLGLRIQEYYPTRFDVVYDLRKGEVKNTYADGNLTEKEKFSVEDLGNGWFLCSITANIYSSYVRLAFGPTNVPEKQTNAWEATSLNKADRELLIIPSSLKVEEIQE